jgi:hypothetical protein
MTEWDDIRDDDIRHGHDTSPTNTLDRPADEELGEIIRNTTNQSTESEKQPARNSKGR